MTALYLSVTYLDRFWNSVLKLRRSLELSASRFLALYSDDLCLCLMISVFWWFFVLIVTGRFWKITRKQYFSCRSVLGTRHLRHNTEVTNQSQRENGGYASVTKSSWDQVSETSSFCIEFFLFYCCKFFFFFPRSFWICWESVRKSSFNQEIVYSQPLELQEAVSEASKKTWLCNFNIQIRSPFLYLPFN